MKVSNWGNYPAVEATVKSFNTTKDLREVLTEFKNSIPRGLGRCYGDSALWQTIVSSLKYNRMLEFKGDEGILTCEAGVSLEEILDIFVPLGWFLPVTPGTKFITVGGAIASDVHGKNHHKEGTFSDHLLSAEIMQPDGSILRCSVTENPEILRAVCGGMGLTGIILHATFKLRKIETAYIKQRTVKARDINEIMDLFKKHEASTYSVAWIDCLSTGKSLGRSILILGEHAMADELRGLNVSDSLLAVKKKKKLTIPFTLPDFVLNKFTARAFNALYYAGNSQEQCSLVDYDTFFYPLDRVYRWNKLYGSAGFTQYQCVLPKQVSQKGLNKILCRISACNIGSFLAILKLMGPANSNLISFPMEGYTLALDFPITPRLFPFLDELDKIVLEYGGRLYLAKDARMSSSMFSNSYKRAEVFANFKHRIDKDGRFRSLQSERLGI